MLPYLLSYVVMAFVLQVSGAILFEATLSMLGLGPSGAVSLGVMLYWAIAWGSVRTGAWWAFVPPTLMLTLISFGAAAAAVQPERAVQPAAARGKMRPQAGTARRRAARRRGPSADRLSARGVVAGSGTVGDHKVVRD